MRLTELGLRVSSHGGPLAPVQWSPCGRRIGFNAFDQATQKGWTVFIEPLTGATWKHESVRFGGFIEYHRWVEAGTDSHNVCDVETGRVLSRFRLPDAQRFDTLAAAPPVSGGAFVASWHGDIRPCIGLVRSDFMPGRPIYTWPAEMQGIHVFLSPKIDPAGEWAAWSDLGATWAKGIYVRGLREDPAAPLTSIMGTLEFCDWTEDGFILANAWLAYEPNGLLVLQVDGTLVRRVPTEVRPMPGLCATYRKFGHR
jgi:hypothetical protein